MSNRIEEFSGSVFVHQGGSSHLAQTGEKISADNFIEIGERSTVHMQLVNSSSTEEEIGTSIYSIEWFCSKFPNSDFCDPKPPNRINNSTQVAARIREFSSNVLVRRNGYSYPAQVSEEMFSGDFIEVSAESTVTLHLENSGPTEGGDQRTFFRIKELYHEEPKD